ncbi:hypothetical protein [Armatimonas sp.]
MRLGYRMYDASTGRFISRDPIQDGYNWYTSVRLCCIMGNARIFRR